MKRFPPAIARLETIGFYQFKGKGDDWYFEATAVVEEPAELRGEIIHNGPKVMADTKECTFAERVAWVNNELRKLGVDIESPYGIEFAIAYLQEHKPRFTFRWAVGGFGNAFFWEGLLRGK